MSILDQEQIIQVPTNPHKIKYLKNEISILKQQQQVLKIVQDKFRLIINLASEYPDSQNNQQEIIKTNNETFEQLIKLKEFLIEKVCYLQNQQNDNSYTQLYQMESVQSKCEIYKCLIESLKSCLKKYQNQLKNRQTQLQIIEQYNEKLVAQQQFVKESKQIKKSQNTKNYSVKSIQAYDINSKLLQGLKKQMVFLKMKKRKLSLNQIQNSVSKQTNKSTKYNSLQSTTKNSCLYKENSRQQISVFEKVVQTYKKTKLINQFLQQKVCKMKKAIKNNKLKNQLFLNKQNKVKKILQNLEWENIDMEHYNVGQKHKLNVGYDYSLLNRTNLRQKNNEESFQKSRFGFNQSIICPK